MRMDTKTFIFLELEDKTYIREQMKSQKLKIKTLCEEMGISRSYFYDMLDGRRCANNLIIGLGYHFISPKYQWEKDCAHRIAGE